MATGVGRRNVTRLVGVDVGMAVAGTGSGLAGDNSTMASRANSAVLKTISDRPNIV
jgi:hypothetical protein